MITKVVYCRLVVDSLGRHNPLAISISCSKRTVCPALQRNTAFILVLPSSFLLCQRLFEYLVHLLLDVIADIVQHQVVAIFVLRLQCNLSSLIFL